MPLNKDARMQNISRIQQLEDKKIGMIEVEWDGQLKPMDYFQIPIEYLVYNKYNGRILSRTKSLETQNVGIDVETQEGNDLIQKLLFDSHPSRNNKTEINIRKYGQKEVGIVTKDGIVIDGNRRLMFLNRISQNPGTVTNPEKFKNFKAVILPATLTDAPNEIRKLETTYQMGEDEKLSYKPIEKYLKAQELENNQVPINSISEWMGETEGEIKKYLETIKVMDDYLEFLEYTDIYTQLDGREDWFLALTKWLGNFQGEESKKAFDGYTRSDVDDLTIIFYDYIRAKHGGDSKRFRRIAEGQKENHIFGNKELWQTFRGNHFEKIEDTKDNEEKINYNAQDLKSHLDDRDKKFTQIVEEGLKENLNDRISELSNKNNHDKPEKLIKKASSALNEVNIKAQSFNNPDTQKQLAQVASKAAKLLCDNKPLAMLEQALNWLSDVQINIGGDDTDEQLKIITQINKLSHKMKKKLGG